MDERPSTSLPGGTEIAAQGVDEGRERPVRSSKKAKIPGTEASSERRSTGRGAEPNDYTASGRGESSRPRRGSTPAAGRAGDGRRAGRSDRDDEDEDRRRSERGGAGGGAGGGGGGGDDGGDDDDDDNGDDNANEDEDDDEDDDNRRNNENAGNDTDGEGQRSGVRRRHGNPDDDDGGTSGYDDSDNASTSARSSSRSVSHPDHHNRHRRPLLPEEEDDEAYYRQLEGDLREYKTVAITITDDILKIRYSTLGLVPLGHLLCADRTDLSDDTAGGSEQGSLAQADHGPTARHHASSQSSGTRSRDTQLPATKILQAQSVLQRSLASPDESQRRNRRQVLPPKLGSSRETVNPILLKHLPEPCLAGFEMYILYSKCQYRHLVRATQAVRLHLR